MTTNGVALALALFAFALSLVIIGHDRAAGLY